MLTYHISALNGLTNLETLDLRVINGGSELSDISPLSKLTNLRTLILWNNSINDISALSGLTNLEYLDLVINYELSLEPQKKIIESLKASGVIVIVR